MTIATGSFVGPYEVTAQIGAGGMGEVYRARDSRLKRDVALKILPASFASDPDRLARFQREAEVLAALNHPHIATIHGIEHVDETRALVLELVDGETLADRLAREPIPLAEAISIARQIADALDAAHQQGIVHRDLKPANVKVSSQGVVKVLDFGLATVVADPSVPQADATYSPTLTLAATRAGIILGTAAYMSPEQASGKPADKRADIWSFGVVLWELLTRRRLFDGETISHTLAFVLTKEVDWNGLPANTPASVQRLLRRCLERDRQRRLPDIGTARFELDDALTSPVAPGVPVQPVAPPRWKSALPWAVAAIAIAVGAYALWARPQEAAPVSPIQVSIDVGANVSLVNAGAPSANLALSPNGEVLAFVGDDRGESHLYLRRFETLNATRLEDTRGARNPFFSPDGRWLGFFADGKLKKIAVAGGGAIPLADATAPRGGWWAEDDTIIYVPSGAPGTPIMRVAAAGGGKAEPLAAVADEDNVQRYPQLLPGDKALLFTSSANGSTNMDDADVVVQVLPNGPRTVVQRGGYFGRYSSSGHVLYMHRGTLFAVPFDAKRLMVTGQTTVVAENVTTSSGVGATQLALSAAGRLVYKTGAEGTEGASIAWLDRKGTLSLLRTAPSDWSNPAFSPDGTRLAMDVVVSGGVADIIIFDWMRDTFGRLTTDPTLDLKPVWTPDSRRVLFASARSKTRTLNVFWQRADLTGEAQQLTAGGTPQVPTSFHPTRNLLAYAQLTGGANWDLYLLPIDGDEASGWKPGTPRVLLNSPHSEQEAVFSRDGRWIAYQSDENGANEIFVQPLERSGGRQQISSGGGVWPMWSPTRDELFFQSPNGQIMAVSYRVVGGAFQPGTARPLPGAPFLARPRLRSVGIHPDGNRFAIAPRPVEVADRSNMLILRPNFGDELKRTVRPDR